MFIILKTDYFQFSLEVTCAFQLQKNVWELSELSTFEPTTPTRSIFHISDPLQVSSVLL